MLKVDALIVGAGPAGSTCAYELAKGGLRVMLVDTKREVGSPVQCAEFVPVQLRHQFGDFFSEDGIAQKVENMVHFTPWGEVVSMWSEGYVLNREVFDKKIAELAIQRGAECLLRTHFLSFENGMVWLQNIESRQKFSIKAHWVVGADGPRSKVARLTGKGTENFLVAVQTTMPLKTPLKDLLIYFRDYIPGGYGWIFPKGKTANVGVGLDPAYGVGVMDSMKRFLQEVVSEGVVEDKVLKRTGGWIPADGLLPLVRGKTVLVGDAGGFCHPITGGGIANAITSGSLAAKAILRGDPESFEEESQEIFGSSLWRAAEKRKRHMKKWDRLHEVIPRTWIAFEEYWRII